MAKWLVLSVGVEWVVGDLIENAVVQMREMWYNKSIQKLAR